MSSPVTPPLEVSDVADGGSVTGRPITTIEVTDGTLSVSGRTATITTGGGGGSGTVTSITAAADSGSGTAITTSGTFTFTGGTGVTTSVSGTTVTIVADNNGDVTATGTPVDNQLAIWDSATSIEGDANLTWDGSTLTVTGALDIDNIKVDGNTISSTDTDGAIDLSPDGAGVVTMYNAYRFPTAVTTTNDYVLTAQTDGTTAWAEVSGGSGTVTSVAGSGTSGITVTGGPITTSGTLTVDLDDTAVTPGTYGDASNVAQITIDQQGRITAAADVAISGGGGSPGGSDTEIQYNDGGAFGGNAAMTFDDTSGDEQVLVSASSTVAPLKVVQTGAGNAFEVFDQAGDTTAFAIRNDGKVGINTTPSGGLTYDLVVGGEILSSKISSSSDGTTASPAYRFQSDGDCGMYLASAGVLGFSAGGATFLEMQHDGTATDFRVGTGSGTARITADGSQNLILQTNDGTNSGTITIQQGTDQDLLIEPDGTGLITFYTGANAWTIENGQGDADQVLTSDGAGAATWEDAGGGTAGAAQIIGVPYGFNGGTDFAMLNRSPFGTIKTATKSWSQAGCMCYPFIARKAGVIDTATLYVSATGGTTTGTLDFAIYSDNAGIPNAKLGECSFDPTTASQQTETVDSSVTTVAGTQYWAVLVKNGTDANPTLYANNITYENALGVHSSTFGEGNPMLNSSSDTTLPASFTASNLAANDLPRYALGVRYT